MYAYTITGVLATIATLVHAQTLNNNVGGLASDIFPEELATSSINPTQLVQLSSDILVFTSTFLAANPVPTILTGDILDIIDPSTAPIPSAIGSALESAFSDGPLPTNAAEASSFLAFFSGLPQSSAVAELVSANLNFALPAESAISNIVASDLGIMTATAGGSMVTMSISMPSMTAMPSSSSSGVAPVPTQFVMGAVAAAAGAVGMALL